MSPPQIEAVLAGTKGFALALLAPVTERVGTRPRLATDPAHALVFCRGPGGLVVVEYLGEDSLSAIKDLVLDGEGVRIVAAVPAKHAAADEPLRALGVEPVRWDGTPDGVLGAIERQLASAPAPAAPRPAAPPAARAVAAKIAPPSPPRKPAAPRAPAPARAPARAVAAARPALTPAKPPAAVAVPPAAPAPSPALDPALEAAFSAIAKPLPPPPAARPTAEAVPDPDSFAALVDELAAAAESLGPAEDPAPEESRGSSEDPAPADSPSLAADAPRPPGAIGAAELFDDLQDAHEFDVDLDEPGVALAPPRDDADADAPWPTAVPGPVEAADALGRGLLGDVSAAGTPLAVVGAVIASLSELERAVFSGEPQPLDTEPVRRAAVMRVRVAVALATAPAAGGAVDAGAVSAFLGDIDALLSDVNALAMDAPSEVQASLEAMRNALVKEAIDFSEAVQRAGRADAPEPSAAPRARAPHARVLSISAASDAGAAPRRPRAVWVAFAIAALLAGGYHAHERWSAHERLRQAPLLPGLAGAMAPAKPAAPGVPQVVTHVNGEAFDARELDAFAADEAKKGNVVKRIAPGAILIVPAEPGAITAPGAPQGSGR